MMNRNVWKAIESHQMLKCGDHVVAAVSGGADSVALLHFLVQNAAEQKWEITVCHVNHNLRGEESRRDARFVEALCKKYGVSLRLLNEDVAGLAKKQKLGVEECAREVRYSFFEQVAKEQGAKIATAHTLSDSLETVLFHLARGTSLRGLTGIPPVRGNIIRPFIDCSRKDVEMYCREHGLAFVEDSTNASDEYTRNRIRHHVVPELERINPSLFHTLSGTLETLRQDDTLLQQQAQQLQEQSETKQGLMLEPLRTAALPLRRRALAAFLAESGVELSGDRLRQVLNLVESGNGTVTLGSALWLRAAKGELFWVSEKEKTPYFELPVGANPVVLPSGMICAAKEIVQAEKINKNLLYILLDCDTIRGTVFVRQRRPGDTICLAGRSGTKSLKKLFNEQKIPLEMRDKIAVFCDEDGVLAVEGIGPAKRAAATPKTTRWLSLNFEPSSSGKDQK